MPAILLVIPLGLFVIGFCIAARYFKHPVAVLFGGLAFGAGLCALAMGILYAGCMLIMRS